MGPAGSTLRSIVIATVVRAPYICGIITTLGGRAGYGKNRKLFTSETPPHKVGEEALAEWIPLSEGKRSGPWVKWLLLLIKS